MTRQINRRTALNLALSGAAVAAAAPFGLQPAWAEDKFTLSSAGGTWGASLRTAFVTGSEFEKIDIAYEEGGDSVRLAKLLAQRGNPLVSAINLLITEQVLAAEAGAVQSYNTDIVTNLKDLYPEAVGAPVNGMENWSGAFSVAMLGFVWNTKEVAAAPTSWKDLWNPKYKGRIGIPDYGWIGISWLHALNHELGGKEDNIDAAISALADLRKKNDAVVIGSSDQAYKSMASGEIVMLPWFNGRAFELQEKGFPIDIAYVKNCVVQNNSYLIAKGGKNIELANRFVQRTLEPETQLALAKATRYAPANRKVKMPADLARYAIPASAMSSAAPIDWSKLNKHRSAYLRRWTQEVLI